VPEPWLRTFFGYLGVRNMQYVIADGAAAVKYGKIDHAAFMAPHPKTIRALFSESLCS
jgi:FMN-dependent NADH-azoreductase